MFFSQFHFLFVAGIYSHGTDFYMLILLPVAFLNSLTTSRRISVDSLGFYIFMIWLPESIDGLISSFPNCLSLLPFLAYRIDSDL